MQKINKDAREIDFIRNNIVHAHADSVFSYFLRNKINNRITNNNTFKLFHSGKDKFDDLFEYIEKAQHHIHLEYFNFRDDSIGNALFDLLAEKAKQGVEVRVICDAFGNWSNNKPFKKKKTEEIRSKNIGLVFFRPLRFPYITYALHRDHRKNVIIDGKVGYLGGMNVADYYITGRPDIGGWHDTHLRIEGDAVKDLQEIFLFLWNNITAQDIGGTEYYPETEITVAGEKPVAIIDRTPIKRPRDMRLTYAMAISAAQHKIRIVNPYFLPTVNIRIEIQKALERGVEVEIMFSEKSDIPFTPEGALKYAYDLVGKGARVYLYKDAFKHSKIMMVDDSFCTVGSTNLDCRSLRFDFEINAFIFDKETTGELIDRFETDKQNSIRISGETWKERSAWKKFVGWVADLIYPFL